MIGTGRAPRARAWAATLFGGLVLLGIPAAPAAVEDSPGTVTYLHSSDGGDSFSPLQLQDRDTNVGATHVVAAEDGTVHTVYDSEDEDKGPRQVRYRRSTDGGRSFAASRQLDVTDEGGAPADGDSSESDLDVEGDHVFVVWEDDKLGDDGTVDPCCEPDHPEANPDDENRDDIFWSASSDTGESFSVPVNLTGSDDVHNRDPDVAAAGRRVALVYEGDDVMEKAATDGDDVLLQVSTDGGDSWGDERNLTFDAGGGQAEPAVDITKDAIHVLYRDRQEVAGPADQETVNGPEGGEPDAGDVSPLEITRVGYVRLDSEGGHPTPPVLLPGPQAKDSVVLVEGDTVHVVACGIPIGDDPLEQVDLLYYRGTDDGRVTTFADPVVLTRAAGCSRPVLDGQDQDLHLAMGASSPGGEEDVFYLRSRDGGRHFEEARNVSSNPMASGDPSLSVDPENGDVHLAWNDQTVFLFGLRTGQVLPEEDGRKLQFWNEDVIQYSGRAYRMVLDGSDVGLRDFEIDALARLSPTEYVLSFMEAGEVPGAGWVDDSDLVLFTADRLGRATSGTFTLWFEGADIGLTEPDEDIDAVEVVHSVDPDTGEIGNVDLYLSTLGTAETSDGTPARDEDIVLCRGAATGSDSACTETRLAFEGAAAGLTGGEEGIDAFSFDGVGPGLPDEKFASYYSTPGTFSVSGAEGSSSDALECFHADATPASDDPLAGCGQSSVPLVKVFDGKDNLLVENLTALEFPYKA